MAAQQQSLEEVNKKFSKILVHLQCHHGFYLTIQDEMGVTDPVTRAEWMKNYSVEQKLIIIGSLAGGGVRRNLILSSG